MNGEYGVHLVRGAQGAWPNGTYPYGAYRKVIREMKHFSMYSLEAGRNSANDDYNISLRDMDEYYLVALRECIQQADIGAYMCSCECVHSILLVRKGRIDTRKARKHSKDEEGRN